RGKDAIQLREGALDGMDAASAVNIRYGQLDLHHPATQRTAGETELLCRHDRALGRSQSTLRHRSAAAPLNTPSRIWIRRTSRYGNSRPASASTSMIHAPSPRATSVA